MCLKGYKTKRPMGHKKAGLPLSRKARPVSTIETIGKVPLKPYFAAPPWNHAAIFIRSPSVICVTLPSGIAFNVTAC